MTWNLLPFWGGFALATLLFATRHLGAASENPLWNFSVRGTEFHLAALVMYFYGPLIDAPHLWATIARTYTDKDEWGARRRLFLGSLVWLLAGPVVILFPYLLRALFHLPAGSEAIGWVVWSNFFTFYALFHINKQHWGFISLYRRKNLEAGDSPESRVDLVFFNVAIWAPYVAMLSAPWYVDFDGKPFVGTTLSLFGTTTGALLHATCHAVFIVACVAYAAFQVEKWRTGSERNGPKLVYLATVVPLNYFAFAIHPLVAAFWVVIVGVGHCAQYHRIVWAYGQTKYVGRKGAERRVPSIFFERVWLYVVLGLAFGLVTLQGPVGGRVVAHLGALLHASVLGPVFAFLTPALGIALGVKVAAAFVSGVRLHHFYVDSKIWRVSKSRALASHLNVRPVVE